MRIIPAIDIIGGKCVRLSKGRYDTKKVYSENPLEMAKYFEGHGIKYLHMVDLDGAREGFVVNHKLLSEIASKTSLSIDFGGGVKTEEDVMKIFDNGARQITGGSIAVKDPGLFRQWITKYGSDRIILGADFYPGSSGSNIAISGWQQQTGEELIPFIMKYLYDGIRQVICTDISKDGMMAGPGIDTYKALLDKVPGINLIASGGVSDMEDILALQAIGCEGTIIGKAIYEGTISLKQLEIFADAY